LKVQHYERNAPGKSKLNLLVPTIGTFFTKLYLEDAFKYQDQQRFISRRRFVAPSFNDIRLILNSAQVLGLVRSSDVKLVTFDGDVTLYDDGACLTSENPVIPRILRLLEQDRKVGIVTAAGYTDAPKYYERLHGLLDAINDSTTLTADQKQGLIVMGGESNYLFRFDPTSDARLVYVRRSQWLLDEMQVWSDDDITELLDIAESALRACVDNLNLPAAILRKDRAVGVYPVNGVRISREQLEETVLVVHHTVQHSAVGGRLPFCAFNGGNDVFVDIGDKSWGVRACQRYFGGIDPAKTLHVGDQFLSAGANDFKVSELLSSPVLLIRLTYLVLIRPVLHPQLPGLQAPLRPWNYLMSWRRRCTRSPLTQTGILHLSGLRLCGFGVSATPDIPSAISWFCL
jgi:IMP and pyridine-specific 5'-nucleotidase